jgi:hypothetical protein
MAMLAFLLATLLDPVQAALVLAAVLLYRGPQPILVAGAAAAAVSETVTVMAAVDYTWGELLVPRFAASLVQAAALWWLVRLMRQARPGGDAPQARGGPFAEEATAALRSLSAGSAGPSLRALAHARLRSASPAEIANKTNTAISCESG